jgi:hypothetical protein
MFGNDVWMPPEASYDWNDYWRDFPEIAVVVAWLPISPARNACGGGG